ncbi:MAG: ABC transporter permease subunit [Verrucomicrobiales bacterium]|nr:ABC transporter permease subunit [Verrucomicrobiales bacterium]
METATTNAPRAWSPQHVWIIALYSMRFALRSGGGLMFLLIFLTVGLSIASLFIAPLEELVKMDGPDGMSASELSITILESDMVADAVEWITSSDSTQSEYLLKDNPALLSAILLILLIAVPFTTCFGAFNQTSGDIASRGLRYLLLRTERSNIFLGRFLGVLLFTIVSVIGTMLVILLYVQFKVGAYPGMDLWLWGFQGLTAVFFLSLPYIALCAWISCMLDSPFGSLAICLLISGFSLAILYMLKLALVSSMQVDPENLGWLVKTVPWGWKYELLHGALTARITAILAMLGFTAAFLFLGLRHFKKRDL